MSNTKHISHQALAQWKGWRSVFQKAKGHHLPNVLILFLCSETCPSYFLASAKLITTSCCQSAASMSSIWIITELPEHFLFNCTQLHIQSCRIFQNLPEQLPLSKTSQQTFRSFQSTYPPTTCGRPVWSHISATECSGRSFSQSVGS